MAIKWQVRELVGKQYIFVSHAGNDTNADTYWTNNPLSVSNRSTPYLTKTGAINAMNTLPRFTTDNVVIVVGNGIWQENTPATRSKGDVTWFGSENTIFDYSTASKPSIVLADAFINQITFRELYSDQLVTSNLSSTVRAPSFTNCKFQNITGTAAIFGGNANGLGGSFFFCELNNSRIASESTGRYTSNIIAENCLLDTIFIQGVGSGIYTNFLKFINNTVKSFNGWIATTGEFDFNNIEGVVSVRDTAGTILSSGDQATISGDGYNTNGSAFDTDAVVYNDPSNGDYTQKTTSPLLLAGKQGANVGPKGLGYYFNAQSIWDNKLSSTGFTIVNGKIVQDAVANAEIITDILDFTTDIRLGFLRLGAIFGYDVAGQPTQYVIPLGSTGEGGRKAYTIEFKAWADGDTEPASYKKLNIEQPLFEDDSGNAPGDDNVNLDEMNSIVARYLRLKVSGLDETI